MRNRVAVFVYLSILIVIAAGGGCAGGPASQVETTPKLAEATPVDDADMDRGLDDSRTDVEAVGWDKEPTTTEDIDADPLPGVDGLLTIYFGFDSYELDETSLTNLKENARWISAHPEATIVVEGHCDERGTIEYNLALGGRRANTVRAYLEGLGIERSRLRIVSYGEERPTSDQRGELAWSQDRRAESVVERTAR